MTKTIDTDILGKAVGTTDVMDRFLEALLLHEVLTIEQQLEQVKSLRQRRKECLKKIAKVQKRRAVFRALASMKSQTEIN
jgi:hypothetical protein